MNSLSQQPESNLPSPVNSAAAQASSSDTPHVRWTSAEILGGQREVLIVHGTETYRLRVTRQGKLIMTK